MEDTDLMPFGKFKGTQMIDVPAKYLLWLHNESTPDFKTLYPNVFEYIVDCLEVIKREAK